MIQPNHLATPVALAAIALLLAHLGDAAPPPAARGPIATIGTRRVDEADIRRAALVLAQDPLRAKQPSAWRKKLLDLCADRELLGMEAERLGIPREPGLERAIEGKSSQALYLEIRKRWLLADVEPNQTAVDTARAGGLFRRYYMRYILTVADGPTTLAVTSALRRGASLDSIARIYSIHPSARSGAVLGWRMARVTNPASRNALRIAKPGEYLGPYQNAQSYEVYRVDSIAEPTDAEIRETLRKEAVAQIETNYRRALLEKYKFALGPTYVEPVIFASATEPVDSIVASLAADGKRTARGVKPALGVLARAEGDSVTYSDLVRSDLLRPRGGGRARIESTGQLALFCSAAILPRLVIRDARERGLDRDPAVARQLKLIRDELATHAMVERAVAGKLDSAACVKHFQTNAARYRRPAARRALVAMFADGDSAHAALRAWLGIGFAESTLAARGMLRQPEAQATTLFRGRYAEMSLFEAGADPLSLAARALSPGQITPVVSTTHGYAVAIVRGREEARPLTYDEARVRVRSDLRAEVEDAWVVDLLQRLRAATPVQRFPSRLEAIRLGGTATGGTSP